jgi:hypothetical protein
MRIDRSLEKRFPVLADWIKTEIPKCQYNARIFDAFQFHSRLTPPAAIMALSFNEAAPTIDVAIMRSYGKFRNRSPSKVFIRRKLCRHFEELHPDARATSPLELIVKATILHEMIHWADYADDQQHRPTTNVIDNVTGATLRNVDVGFQFEIDAFYGIYTEEYLTH